MPLSGMSKYWLEAESALPTGWLLYGVVRGPRQVDPRIDSAMWCAFARPHRDDAAHRDIPMVEGRPHRGGSSDGAPRQSERGSPMTRRGHGEGSIFKRKDNGLWVGTVNLGWQGGKRVRRSFYGKTRREVQAKLQAALRDVEAGVTPSRQRDTVGAYLVDWLEASKGSIRETTWRRYEQIVKHQLTPHVGRIPIAQLKPKDVEAMLRAVEAEGRAPRTVHHARAVLRTALQRAVRHGAIGRNPAALAAAPRVERREVQSLSPLEVKRLLASLDGQPHAALITTAVATGLRQGELLGLRWTDVDLAGGYITVRHALQWSGGKPQLVETKTAKSRRTVPLPDVARRALVEHQEKQTTGAVVSPFVFTGTVGQPLRHTVVIRALDAALSAAGVPRVTFHALRHTAASLLLAQGTHPRVVMELLGHSTIALTMNTYSHVIPALEREAADRMNALLDG